MVAIRFVDDILGLISRWIDKCKRLAHHDLLPTERPLVDSSGWYGTGILLRYCLAVAGKNSGLSHIPTVRAGRPAESTAITCSWKYAGSCRISVVADLRFPEEVEPAAVDETGAAACRIRAKENSCPKDSLKRRHQPAVFLSTLRHSKRVEHLGIR
jgi:hypothetical protein